MSDLLNKPTFLEYLKGIQMSCDAQGWEDRRVLVGWIIERVNSGAYDAKCIKTLDLMVWIRHQAALARKCIESSERLGREEAAGRLRAQLDCWNLILEAVTEGDFDENRGEEE
jgi:hypothetical protein